jgi:two-component system copper resistance phosphate regulon response regulator CusR
MDELIDHGQTLASPPAAGKRKLVGFRGCSLQHWNMRVLLVEDEARLAETVARGLREEGFVVEVSADGEDALHRLRTEPFDLAVLDVMLPRLDGWAVLETVRAERRPLRVLMLTARQTVADRVRGLESGADDYLVKPFAFAELLARVRAVLRRPVAEEPLHLNFADVELDYRARTARRGGCALRLSPKEFAVLAFLMRHPGEVISRTRLAEEVWDENFDSFSNVIDVTVSHLRAKVDAGFDAPLIHTLRGAGYVLRREDPT